MFVQNLSGNPKLSLVREESVTILLHLHMREFPIFQPKRTLA